MRTNGVVTGMAVTAVRLKPTPPVRKVEKAACIEAVIVILRQVIVACRVGIIATQAEADRAYASVSLNNSSTIHREPLATSSIIANGSWLFFAAEGILYAPFFRYNK